MTTDQDPFFRFIQVALDKKTYLNLIYLLLMFPLGIFYFTIVVTGFSISISLIILIIGIFIAFGFALLVRGLSSVHLYLASNLLLFDLPPKEDNQVIKAGFIEQMKSLFTNTKFYTSMFYMLIELPLGILYFTLIIVLLSLSISFIGAPVLYFLTGADFHFSSDVYLWNIDFEETLLMMVGGLFLFFVTLHMTNLFAKVEELLCKSFLIR